MISQALQLGRLESDARTRKGWRKYSNNRRQNKKQYRKWDILLPFKWDRAQYHLAYMRLMRGWLTESLGNPPRKSLSVAGNVVERHNDE